MARAFDELSDPPERRVEFQKDPLGDSLFHEPSAFASNDEPFRTPRAAARNTRIQERIRAEDLQARGIPTYRNASGGVSPITDDTGSTLTGFDSKHNIAYDSAGNPKQITYDETGPPKLSDPFATLPTLLDDKTGALGKFGPGGIYQYQGQDPTTTANLARKEKDKNIQHESALLNRKLTLDEHDFHAGVADKKVLTADLKQAVPTLLDPKYDGADKGTVLKAIDEHFNAQYAAPEANETAGWFGKELSPQATARRQQIDSAKAKAYESATGLFDLNDKLSALHETVTATRETERANVETLLAHSQGKEGPLDIPDATAEGATKKSQLFPPESEWARMLGGKDAVAAMHDQVREGNVPAPAAPAVIAATHDYEDAKKKAEAVKQSDPTLYEQYSNIAASILHGITTGVADLAKGSTAKPSLSTLIDPLQQAGQFSVWATSALTGAEPGQVRDIWKKGWESLPAETGKLVDERLKDSIGTKVGNFIGGIAPYAAVAIATKGKSVATPLMASMFYTSGYQSTYDDAKAHGASDERADASGMAVGAINALLAMPLRTVGKAAEAIFGASTPSVIERALKNAFEHGGPESVGKILGQLSEAIKAGGTGAAVLRKEAVQGINAIAAEMKKTVAQRASDVVQTALGHAALGAGVQTSENLVKKNYNPDQGTFEGVGEQALGFGVLGGLSKGFEQIAMARKAKQALDLLKPKDGGAPPGPPALGPGKTPPGGPTPPAPKVAAIRETSPKTSTVPEKAKETSTEKTVTAKEVKSTPGSPELVAAEKAFVEQGGHTDKLDAQQKLAALQEAVPDPVKRIAAIQERLASNEAAKSNIHEAATSPQNNLPEPTQAQKKAGNYQKGHVQISGLDISIENPAGSKRQPEFKPLESHYGYIKGTVGADKDHVDIFVKKETPADWAGPVFVVNQVNAKGKFDEHKAVIGVKNQSEALKEYDANYQPGWKGAHSVVKFENAADFKTWATSGATGEPVSQTAVRIRTPEGVSMHKPQIEGAHVVSTAVKRGEQYLVGSKWNTPHEGIGAFHDMETVKQSDRGFIVQDEKGNQSFVSRKEAGPIAEKAGQNMGPISAEGIQSAELQPAVSRAENKVTNLVKGTMAKHRATLESLNHDVAPRIGQTKNESGVEAKFNRSGAFQIVLDPVKLAKATSGMSDREQSKFVQGEIDKAVTDLQEQRSGVAKQEAPSREPAAPKGAITQGPKLADLVEQRQALLNAEDTPANREQLAKLGEAISEIAPQKETGDVGADQIERIADGAKERKAAERLASAPETSPAKLRVQKAFLLDALDKAIVTALQTVTSKEHDADIIKIREATQYRGGERPTDEQAMVALSDLSKKYGIDKWRVQTPADQPWLNAAGGTVFGPGLKEQTPAQDREPTAKEQHDELLKRAEAAREKALPHIQIEVPGDGTFTIINSKESLQAFRDSAKKRFPTVGARAESTGGNLRATESKITPVGKPKGAGNAIRIASIAVSKDSTRAVLLNILSNGKQVVATDGRRLLMIDAKAGGTIDKPILFTPDVKRAKSDIPFPNFRQVIPNANEQKPVATLDTGAMQKLLAQAMEMTSDKSNSVKVWLDKKGEVGLTSQDPEMGEFAGGSDPATSKFLAAYNPTFLMDGMKAARALGHEQVTLSLDKKTPEMSPAVISAPGMTYVLMPMRVDSSSASHPLAIQQKAKTNDTATASTRRSRETASDSAIPSAKGESGERNQVQNSDDDKGASVPGTANIGGTSEEGEANAARMRPTDVKRHFDESIERDAVGVRATGVQVREGTGAEAVRGLAFNGARNEIVVNHDALAELVNHPAIRDRAGFVASSVSEELAHGADRHLNPDWPRNDLAALKQADEAMFNAVRDTYGHAENVFGVAMEYIRMLAQVRAKKPLTESFFRDTTKVERLLAQPQASETEAMIAKMLGVLGWGPKASRQIDTPEFKRWFGESKVVNAGGEPLIAKHGTARPDRIGTVFRKSRATSGPMAFFTTGENSGPVASGYATGKTDTSLEGVSDYSEWFKIKPKGSRSEVNIDRAWWHLTPEQRKTATERLYTVGYQNHYEGEGPIVHDSESIMGRDSIDWQLKEARGNALRAAVEIWLNSAALFNDEEKFLNVLKGMGVEGTRLDHPHRNEAAVYPVFLKIENPLATKSIPPAVVEALQKSANRQPTPKQGIGADSWDKNTRDPQEWMTALREDIEKGLDHAWTSIPDWVTRTLKSFGYDGIHDQGGKFSGIEHQVWIPFEETQVKSAIGNRGTFDPTSKNIVHLGGPAEGEPPTIADIGGPKFVQKLKRKFAPGLDITTDIKEGIQSLLLPSAQSPAHLKAAELLGSKLGPMHRRQEVSRATLKKDWMTFEKLGVHREDVPLTKNRGIQFMSDITQAKVLDPKLKPIADRVQGMFAGRVALLEKADAPLETVREHYFPGMWTRESREAFNAAVEQGLAAGIIGEDFNPNDATADQQAWIKERADKLHDEGNGSEKDAIAYLTRRPLKGRESFRKQKVFDDIMTGVKFGLRPISNNPVDLVMLKLAEMDKNIMANEVFQQLKKDGQLKTITPFDKVPDGWAKVQDKYGTIYGPRPTQESDTPANMMEAKKPSQYVGLPILGYRIVPMPTADILNNYLSSSLYNNRYFGKLYTGWMGLANALNQTQLGVGSAFHAGFTTMEAQISGGANLVKDIYGLLRGNRSLTDLLKTTKNLATASVETGLTGDKILNAWRNPDGVIDPRIAQVVKAAELAGAGFKLETGLQTDQASKFVSDWLNGHRLRAARRSPVAFVEMLAKPIMEWIVPRQKAGVFAHLVWRIIEQNPGKSMEALTAEFRQAWNRVDARLGQVRYDRLFINNTAKNVVQGMVRAPGWSGGTIAELGGAFKDAYKFFDEFAKTKKLPADIPDRVAYAISLLVTVALINAALTMLFTGEKPEGLDWWAFRTGGKDDHGNPERFILPTYVKDIIAYVKEPFTTLLNKSHPLLSIFGDLFRNKDYYGVEIRDQDSNALMQAIQAGGYVTKSFTPFWIRGTQKEVKQSGVSAKALLPLIGVMPAPRKMTQTPAEELASEINQAGRPAAPITERQQERRLEKSDIVSKIRRGEAPNISAALSKGTIKPADVKALYKRAQLAPIAAQVDHMTLENAEKVYQRASLKERAELAGVMERKRSNAAKRGKKMFTGF